MVGWILLGLLLLLIFLVFFLPYGIDAGYEDGEFHLAAQAGPIRIMLYPKKPLTERQQARKAAKAEKKAAKQAAKAEKTEKEEKPEETKAEEAPKESKVKALLGKLDVETVLALLKMGIHAIRRFFRSFTVNFFKLHLLVADADPYNTAMEYAAACAAVEALPALCGSAIRVQRRDVRVGADYLSEEPSIAVRLTLTLQLFRIVHMLVALATEFILWKLKNRAPKAAAASERKEDNGTEQVQ